MEHSGGDEPMDSSSAEQMTSESEQYSEEMSQVPAQRGHQHIPSAHSSMEYVAGGQQQYQDADFQQRMQVQQETQVVPQSAQQTQYLRSTVMRPITGTQLEAMRTGSYVQPGSSLSDFIGDLDQYAPAIPDAVALYFMRKNGIDNPDPRVVRLFSLATQKFVSDIALDAMQQARIKGLGLVRKNTRETRFALTTQLLEPVLEEHGIKVERPPYHVG
ncbi:Taf [Aphelenchoides avenae]|nr:Taf [Aphelenchus avenae]